MRRLVRPRPRALELAIGVDSRDLVNAKIGHGPTKSQEARKTGLGTHLHVYVSGSAHGQYHAHAEVSKAQHAYALMQA